MNGNLFDVDPVANLLPCDGIVQDYGLIFDALESEQCLHYFLQHLHWQADEVRLFGQYYQTERKVAWYADETYTYVYSGMPKQAHIWQPALLRLKQRIEQIVGHPFNSCLANLYENGSQGMGWHSDNERSLGSQPVIASLSFGVTRKFRFKHQMQKLTVDCMLQSGQLLVMRGDTQHYWKHCLSKSTRILSPRINFTFRYFYPNS